MNNSIPINNFNRSGPFYPLVIHYISSLHGVLELFSRAIINRVNSGKNNTQSIPNQNGELVNKFIQKILQGNFVPTPLIANLELKSKFQSNTINVDSDEIAAEFFSNADYLLQYFSVSGASLIINAHSNILEKHTNDHDPLWQFLRHCRHAAAHDGVIFDKYKDLIKLPAKWGEFDMSNYQKVQLFKKRTGGENYLLDPGDPIRLLWDIEQKFY